MGSRRDWETMQHAVARLEQLGVPTRCEVVSAHRTPDMLFAYAESAAGRGLRAIIAGAGGAAHLPGMLAAKTALPVLGVPVQGKALNGLDSLLSIVQMPAGIPVATFAIGAAGAANAGLFAAAHPGAGRRAHRRGARRLPSRTDRGRARTAGPEDGVTTVGILGGGQLARMLALSGAPLGLRFLVLDSVPDACAAQFAPSLQADYRDQDALAAFAAQVDVATFDFENVPAESARWLADRIPVFPSPRALAVAQDRLAEKTLFRELGIGVPGFADIASRNDLDAAIARLGTPAILKTRRLGYDGKGQFRIRTAADADAAWAALGAQAPSVGLILEAFVPFERELSVVAVRGRDGEFRTWPLTENWHEHGMLSASLAPARVDDSIARAGDRLRAPRRRSARLRRRVRARAVRARRTPARQRDGAARAQFRALDHRGRRDLAVRKPFARGARAAAGRAPRMLGHACMLNWIGELPAAGPVLSEASGHWHDYGKSPRPGRKVGHATFRTDSAAELAAALLRAGAALDRSAQVADVVARLGEER